MPLFFQKAFSINTLIIPILLLTLVMVPASAAAQPRHENVPTVSSALSDSQFQQPYIDVDEWRELPAPHRYVHGGFKGTATRFSFYFPPTPEYEGRFFQHITPVPDSENLGQAMPPGAYNKIGFALASGAYFVETNGGGKLDLGSVAGNSLDSSISAYRANAAAAQYSRMLALAMYGGRRPYGYAYGGSGGAYRTIGSIENTRGVWDGVVPYVPGSTMALPNMFTVRMRAMRILKDKFPHIVDAVEPGGSGTPYAGLNKLEADALREATRMGFPMQSWFGHATMGIHGFAALYQGVASADPEYFTDFWQLPGYLGHDHPEQFTAARLQFSSTVAAPITAQQAAELGLNTDASNEQNRGGVDNAFRAPASGDSDRIVAFRLAGTPPPVDFLGGDLIISSGPAAGRRLPLARISDDIAVLGIADASVAAQICTGDVVQIDNSNFLAMETYHRHQVPGPEFKVWDQFRRSDGGPLYPQRPTLLGPSFVQATSGSQMTGQFEAKMIMVASLWDREAMPWQADWYRQRVQKHLGKRTDAHFRLWYIDRALHGDEPLRDPKDLARTVSYQGVLQQALRDLSLWVERDIAPPATTQYRVHDGQVLLPTTALERRGIQPVVKLLANDGVRANVSTSIPVTLIAHIEWPDGAGQIVSAEWDPEGTGNYPISAPLPANNEGILSLQTQFKYDRPGVYFPAVRVTSQRQGDTQTPYARIHSLDRARVVVDPPQ